MDAKQEKERIDVPPSEWEVSELLDILNGTGSAAFVLTLRRLAFQRDRLAAELARYHSDAAETDASIRASAKTVLPAAKVDGDRTCVPPVEEVVELLAAEVAELRRVLREYQDQRDLGFIEFLTDSSEQMNREIDAAMSPKV